MNPGPSLRFTVGSDLDRPSSSPPSKLLSVTRRKIRKKSIRNTKDSAEMARLKYHRQQPQPLSQKADRHFSVANVGSNGTVYLRPVVRAYPRPFQQPPPTPPDTSDRAQRSSFDWHDGLHESAAAPSLTRQPSASIESGPRRRSSFDSSHTHTRHRASRDTVTRMRSPSADSIDPRASRDVAVRPSTANPLSPTLEVPIPSYRLGSLRFSDRGTATLHNSIHTAFSSTSDLRPLPSPSIPEQRDSPDLRASPSVSWFSPSVEVAATSQTGKLRKSPLAAPPLEQGQNDIPYTIYDKVASDPDNLHWVNYECDSRSIVAATPARLVAEITSVKFLDYDLLSDFFLTYRAFLSPSDLARYLVARLRWAVYQTHASGRIVRVRTFVALRHWTLNYFTQDFEPDHDLRVLFCHLVNKLAYDLNRRPQGGGGGDLQVLNELQKCWNRTCALVWGSLDAPQSYMPLRLEHDETQQLIAATRMRSLVGEPHTRNISNADASTAPIVHRANSTWSDASVDATSCSLPILKRSKLDLEGNPEKPSGPQASKKSHGLFSRHKRTDSFSDSLRDSRVKSPAAPTSAVEEVETLAPAPPGRLIRGLVIHPRSANVVGPAPPSPPFLVRPEDTRPSLMETLLNPPETPTQTSRLKILGSVRRALSTRAAPKSSFSLRPRTPMSRDSSQQPKDMIKQIHSRKADVHTDALAAMVMRSWEQQDSPPPTPEFNGEQMPVQRKRSKTLHTDVPRPNVTRFDSELTTSSRSILIMDDTGLEDPVRIPEMPRPRTAIKEEDQVRRGLQRQTIREHNQSTIASMAMNNTAFLLPDRFSVKTSRSGSIVSTTLSLAQTTSSFMSGPQSPPPSIPLPPLPSMFGSSPKSDFVPSPLGACMSSPEFEEMESFNSPVLGLPREAPAESTEFHFRKSSLVDPYTPARQIRRRPGGNLREVDTIQDLGIVQRRQSTGSISSPFYPSPSSAYLSVDDNAKTPSRVSKHPLKTRLTAGDLLEAAKQDSLRLLSVSSSSRNLRPSMESEVARLRALSQHEDDGGVESALLKLEGRFISSHSSNKTLRSFVLGSESNSFPTLTRQTHRNQVQVMGHPDHPQTSRLDLEDDTHSDNTDESVAATGSAEPAKNQNDINGFSHKRAGAVNMTGLEGSTKTDRQRKGSSVTVKDFGDIMRTQNNNRPVTPLTLHDNKSSDTPASTFLLDDGESLVESNSPSFVRHAPKPSTDGGRSFFLNEGEGDSVSRAQEKHAPDQLQPRAGLYPLTPPTTADNLSDHGFDDFNDVQLLLPGPPSAKPRKSVRLSKLLLSDRFAERATHHPVFPAARHVAMQHTPFILAHTSEALALQFTLIEKDALDSVDWKDLINLNWSQKVPSVRDWAHYIHSFPTDMSEISSIDLIITRFNLVIKWCISSVLLCSTPQERAQCITKFIHIASYCHRRLRNFATMAQITIALLSSDLARLTTTWTKVTQAEKDTLKELEVLVSPTRNFAVLRAEMESSAAEMGDDESSAKGVIPFIGVYTRDLALNAQKAAFISPSQAGEGPQEKMVNFDRHRTAASIVKGVLRLLDAGSRYVIKPEPEVLAKCLWLAALPDTEISELSRSLER